MSTTDPQQSVPADIPANLYEAGHQAILKLYAWYKVNQGTRNEAATRLHIIDTLLFECLGWDKVHDCDPEEPHGPTFADYVLKCPHRYVIVEAKREGIYFDIPVGKQGRYFTLARLVEHVPNLGPAITQAAKYCQQRGISIGVISNGHQFVAFIGTRDDGIAPNLGKAVVFESMKVMVENFPLLGIVQ